MIKAVVFDLDDTIYDYEYCHEKAMEKFKDYCVNKFSITGEEFENSFNLAKKIVKNRLRNTAASHNRLLYVQNFLEIIGEKPTVHALDLYNQYWNAMLEIMQPYEYVIPLFRKLAGENLKIGILTDLTAHIQYRKIQYLGIDEYIDTIVTSEEAGEEKPNNKMFDLVIEKFKLSPEEIIMIGDSYKKDILGAEAAGMHSIHFEKEDDITERCLEMIKIESGK